MCALVTQHMVSVVGSPPNDSDLTSMDIAVTQQPVMMDSFRHDSNELIRLFSEILEQHPNETERTPEDPCRRAFATSEDKKCVSFEDEPVILNRHENQERANETDVDCIQPGKRQSHCINLIGPIESKKVVICKHEIKRRNSLIRHLINRFAKS